MFLNEISLKNYRKFKEKSLKFNKNYVIIFGENAVGKTTILEAICVLSSTKTPKNAELIECVNFENDFFVVSGCVLTQNIEKSMFVSYSGGLKKAKINNVLCKKISDYSKNFCVVYFQPLDSLKYTTASQNRRNLIDSYICQISDQYLNNLIEYKKLLKDKNALLKTENFSSSKNNFVLLEIINNKMAILCNEIIKERKRQIEKINFEIKKIHSEFSKSEIASIRYLPNMNNPFEEIEKSVHFDVESKTATKGIHKDDFEFLINENNIVYFCSQGQQKSFVLSLKITILELIKNVKGEYPILILDDAFSDLDSNRQNAIFKIIDNKCQTFISTTSLKQLDEEVVKNAQIIEILKGEENYE